MELLRRYGLFGWLRLSLDVALSRWRLGGAVRVVRRPWYIRGRRRIRFGPGFTSGVGLRIDAWGIGNAPMLTIGRSVEVNDHVHIAVAHRVEIGDNVLIASRVFITDHGHGTYDAPCAQSAPSTPPGGRPLSTKAVKIGPNVWIGEQVCILPGVTIGAGAIVGAGSVVTRDVAPETIVAGNPARALRAFSRETNQWERVASTPSPRPRAETSDHSEI